MEKNSLGRSNTRWNETITGLYVQCFSGWTRILYSVYGIVSCTKGATQAKGIWKQDPEANIWAQRDENGTGQGFTMRNFIVCTVHII